MPHSRQKHCHKKFNKPPLFLNPIQRRVLAATTLMVCVLYLIGGEPRQAAALVRKYHTILWDKPTAARLYDFFASASGVPPQEPSTDRPKREKALVKPVPEGFAPKGKFVPMAGGDNQATATCISTLPYNDTGTTVGATDDYNLPADTTNPTTSATCATRTGAGPAGSLPGGAVYTGTGTAPDVVYSMSFPSGNLDTLTITMDPTGAQDLALIVYCNTVSSLLSDALCVDDTGVGGQAETVTVSNIAAGTTLYIVVDGYSTGGTPPGPSGPYTLSVTSNGATQPSCGGGGGCTLTCPTDITVPNDPGECGAIVTFGNPTTSGSCGTVTTSPVSGSFFSVGTTMVTATSSVGGGSCNFNVIVNDTEPPVLNCPGNISMAATSGAGAVVNFSPTASDNCSVSSIMASPPSGSLFPLGTTTVNVTAMDSAGLTDTCSFTVTVVETEPDRLYVADTVNHRVQFFDGINWQLVPGTLGTLGTGNGQFRLPEAIVATRDGTRIYVADTGNNRIQFTTDSGGTWQNFATLGTGLNQVRAPQGLTLDRDDNLYVSDTGNGRVLRFNGGNPGTGVLLASNGTASGQVGRPMGLAIDSQYRLFIPDDLNSRIVRILNANTVTLRDTGSVFVQTGTALNKVRNPQGIGFEADGDMYIADTGNSRVLRFANGNVNSATSIALTGSLLGQVNFAEGVTVILFSAGPFAGQPMVIISDTSNNRIVGRFAAGSQWFLIGNPNNVGTGIGQFRSPSKIH